MASSERSPVARRRRAPSPPRRPEDDIVVVGARGMPLRDLYHAALRASWPVTLMVIVGSFLISNVVFATIYESVGGIAEAREGSYFDAFFFSVETMATIGYGAMHPVGTAAHVLVVLEAIFGLLITALSTGLVFAKFSQPTSRIVFSRFAAISPMNGVPTLAFRVGNQRGNTVAEATIRVAAVKTEKTAEGVTFYRMTDLVLSRDRSPALARSWNVLHPITESSPLHGGSPEAYQLAELELIVTVVGTDDTSLQPVHARHRYTADDVLWGARLADVLSERSDGRLQLDVRRFDEVLPSEATEAFPYRWDPGEADRAERAAA